MKDSNNTREIVEQYHQRWLARDIDGMLALCAPEIEYFDFYSNRRIPFDQLHAYLTQSIPQGPGQHFRYTDAIRADGDTGFIQYEATLSLPRGRLVSFRTCEAITVRDRRILRVHEYSSRIREGEAEENRAASRLGIGTRELELMRLDLEHYFDTERPYRDPELDMSRVAEALGYTRNQISYLLNQAMGMNFYQYVNNARLNELCQRLEQEPEQRLDALVFAVGFNSLSVFYRRFRERTGMSPKAYRAQRLKNS